MEPCTNALGRGSNSGVDLTLIRVPTTAEEYADAATGDLPPPPTTPKTIHP